MPTYAMKGNESLMKRFALYVITLLILTSCAYIDPVRPQAVYEATATARAELALLPTVTPDAPPVTIVPDVLPEDEVGDSKPVPPPEPPCELTKGNISRDGRKLYHVEGMSNFDQVKIDEAAGERFFCSPAEAEAAGWTRAAN